MKFRGKLEHTKLLRFLSVFQSCLLICSPINKNCLDRSDRDSKGGISFNCLPVKRNNLAKPLANQVWPRQEVLAKGGTFVCSASLHRLFP